MVAASELGKERVSTLRMIISYTPALRAAPAGADLPRSCSFKGRISEGHRPRENPKILKNVLTQFHVSRQKGVPQMMCASVQRREKTN